MEGCRWGGAQQGFWEARSVLFLDLDACFWVNNQAVHFCFDVSISHTQWASVCVPFHNQTLKKKKEHLRHQREGNLRGQLPREHLGQEKPDGVSEHRAPRPVIQASDGSPGPESEAEFRQRVVQRGSHLENKPIRF